MLRRRIILRMRRPVWNFVLSAFFLLAARCREGRGTRRLRRQTATDVPNRGRDPYMKGVKMLRRMADERMV